MSEAEPDNRRDPRDPLPEDSILSLEDYLEMQKAIGEETRFLLLRQLTEAGAMSAKELEDALDIAGNRLHHHLNKLVDVGLVENRKRSKRGSDGLYSYYTASKKGELILEHGVMELMRREHEFADQYQ